MSAGKRDAYRVLRTPEPDPLLAALAKLPSLSAQLRGLSDSMFKVRHLVIADRLASPAVKGLLVRMELEAAQLAQAFDRL